MKTKRNFYWLLYPVLLVLALGLSGLVTVLASPFLALLVTNDIVHRPEKFTAGTITGSPLPSDGRGAGGEGSDPHPPSTSALDLAA